MRQGRPDALQGGSAAWARGAVPGLLPVRFPGPLAEPPCVSAQRAPRGVCRQVGCVTQGVGILLPRYRYRTIGPVANMNAGFAEPGKVRKPDCLTHISALVPESRTPRAAHSLCVMLTTQAKSEFGTLVGKIGSRRKSLSSPSSPL